MLTPLQVASRPVGAIPMNGPLWVPRAVKRTTTLSRSEKMSSMVVWRSGKPARRPAMSRFTPSGPCASGPPARSWRTNSGAMISSTAGMSPIATSPTPRRARETVDHAGRAGARYVVVHLGGIESGGRAEMFDSEKRLRRLFDEGVRDGEEGAALRRQAHAARREGVGRNLPQARRSLAEMAEHAARNGVAIGLENRFHYHEFPGIDEMHELLADVPPEVAGFWLDVGHAEVMDRLGLAPKGRWLDELGARCIGAHVHDVDGLADHRAPGRGGVDWSDVPRRPP